MRQTNLDFKYQSPSLSLMARGVSWDSQVFGFPVVQIDSFEIRNKCNLASDYARFKSWVDSNGVGLVSCRLAHTRLIESMFLEASGFRFVEMVLHPYLALEEKQATSNDSLEITVADDCDLTDLREIAEMAFGFERFHVDPRIGKVLADKRYGRWVWTSLNHESQRLLKVMDGCNLIGFFLIEFDKDKRAYWHLTAVSPKWQGLGYGNRVWRAMLRFCRDKGCQSVSTTISARNTPVLNLYAKLQFRFTEPDMTFHWLPGYE